MLRSFFGGSGLISLVPTEGSVVVVVAVRAEHVTTTTDENGDLPLKMIPPVKIFRSGANPTMNSLQNVLGVQVRGSSFGGDVI